MTRRVIALVGCGAQKLTAPAPARELYTGPLFRASLREGIARAGEANTAILSAKHGLVRLDTVLAPYDVYLPRLPRADRLAWGALVLRQLAETFGPGGELHVLAGAPYIAALGLADAWRIVAPMHGLTQGARLAWLKRQRGARAAQ